MHVHVNRWMRIFVCLYVLIKCYCPTAEGGFGQGSSISYRRTSAEETTGPCTLGKLPFLSSKSTKLTILSLNIELNLDILIQNVSNFLKPPGENWSSKPSTCEWVWSQKEDVAETTGCDGAVFWLVGKSQGTRISFTLYIKSLIKQVEWAKLWRKLNLKSLCFVILYRHMLINLRKCTSLFEWCWPLNPECLWLTCLLLEKIYPRSWEPAVVTSGRKQPVPLTRWVRFEMHFCFLNVCHYWLFCSYTISEVRGW